jgi:chitin synthase
MAEVDVAGMRANCFYQRRAKDLFHIRNCDQDLADEIAELRYTPITTPGKELVIEPLEDATPPVLLRNTEKKRKIKLFTVATMYNEPPKGGEFDNQENKAGGLVPTLMGIAENLEQYVERNEATSWRDIVVCIVQDGRKEINEKTLHWLELNGLYSHELMMQQEQDSMTARRRKFNAADWRNNVLRDHDHANLSEGKFTYGARPIQMHLFETVLILKKSGIQEQGMQHYPPMQIMFAMKEYSSPHGRLDSHHWFFNGFCSQLYNNGMLDFCLMTEVGTVARKRAILKLLSALLRNRYLAGCCGELAVDDVSIATMINPIIAGQHFQRKVGCILDKSLESCFGYMTELPSGFSAYRYEALRGYPLQEYFRRITGFDLESEENVAALEAKKFLAEQEEIAEALRETSSMSSMSGFSSTDSMSGFESSSEVGSPREDRYLACALNPLSSN